MVGEVPYLGTNQSIFGVHVDPSVTHPQVVAIFSIQMKGHTAATKLCDSVETLANKFVHIAPSVSTLREPNSIQDFSPTIYVTHLPPLKRHTLF